MASRREATEEAGALAHAIAWLAGLGCRFPWTIAVILLASCVVCLVATFTHLTYHTSRNDLIAPNKDYLQRWQQYVAEFGDDEDMVVVVKGSSRAVMEQALERLAGLIRSHADRFDRLFYKVDLAALDDRALLFLPADQIRQIQSSLKDMHLLLDMPLVGEAIPNFTWAQLTLEQLLLKGERHANSGAAKADGDLFLKQLNDICAAAADALGASAAYRNPWHSIVPPGHDAPQSLREPRYCFSGDGQLAFLLVRPIFRESGSFTAEQACIDTMRRLIDQVGAEFPGLEVGLTGLPVLENDEMLASQNDSKFASWLALIGVALLYLVVYRGLRYPLMTVGSLVLGTIWALGWVTFTVGHLNILSSAFAVMLIGMGDYGVLWVARFDQERRAGFDVVQAMRQTALHVGPSILTAAFTTALAFYATMLADLKAVAELGWIAGSGVLFCALACFLAMPSLLTLFGGRARETSPAIIPINEARAGRRTWLPWLVSRPRWVLGVTAAGVVACGALAFRVEYDHNLLHLQAPTLDSVRWEQTLIEHTAGASWHALSVTTTREEALALKEKFERLPLVSRVVEVASLVPLDQERKLEQLRDIQERLRRLPARGQTVPHEPPDPIAVLRTVARLRGAVARLAHERPGLGALPATLHRLEAAVQALPRAEAARRLRGFEEQLTRDLADDLHRLRDASHPRPIDVADLPDCLRERYIGQHGKWLLRVFCTECLWEYASLERFAGQIASVDPEATGKPFTTFEGLRAMKNGFLWAGLYALLAMLAVLLLDFGNLKHVLLALLPLAIGIAATVGIMGLCGIPLNPANLIAFPLILGVGMDNGVHVVHDYRERLRGPRYHLNQATGRGILVAALTTILGFGTLLIAQHRGLSSLGLVLTLGVACCMLASLVFLPCLLNLLSVRRNDPQARSRVFERAG